MPGVFECLTVDNGNILRRDMVLRPNKKFIGILLVLILLLMNFMPGIASADMPPVGGGGGGVAPIWCLNPGQHVVKGQTAEFVIEVAVPPDAGSVVYSSDAPAGSYSFSPLPLNKSGGLVFSLDTSAIEILPGIHTYQVQMNVDGINSFLPINLDVWDPAQIQAEFGMEVYNEDTQEWNFQPFTAPIQATQQGVVEFDFRLLMLAGPAPQAITSWEAMDMGFSLVSDNPGVATVIGERSGDPSSFEVLAVSNGSANISLLDPNGNPLSGNPAQTVEVNIPSTEPYVTSINILPAAASNAGTEDLTFTASVSADGSKWVGYYGDLNLDFVHADADGEGWSDLNYTASGNIAEGEIPGTYYVYATVDSNELLLPFQVYNDPSKGQIEGSVYNMAVPLGSGTSDVCGTIELYSTSSEDLLDVSGWWGMGPDYIKTYITPGDYKVKFIPDDDTMQPQWYPNADTYEEAAVISVSAGGVVKNIDFFIKPAPLKIEMAQMVPAWLDSPNPVTPMSINEPEELSDLWSSSDDVSLNLYIWEPNPAGGGPIKTFLSSFSSSDITLSDDSIAFTAPAGLTPGKYDMDVLAGTNVVAIAAFRVGEVAQVVEAGLDWLLLQQNSDGSWGSDYEVALTGLAVLNLATANHNLGYLPETSDYRYGAEIQSGLNYILANAHTVGLGLQYHDGTPDDPDSNGNGDGIYFNTSGDLPGSHGVDVYESSIALMAIAASQTPDALVNAPDSPIDGWTYRQVVEDVVDYLAWAQVDSAYGRGGWNYGPCDNNNEWPRADQSNTGWVTLALAYAEAPLYDFEVSTPGFVRSELDIWIDNIQIDNPDYDTFGGASYVPEEDPAGHWSDVNILKTGNLLQQMAFVGDTAAEQRVQDALSYMERKWDYAGWDIGWRGFHVGEPSNYHATYTAMKGFESLGISEFGTADIDWYDDFKQKVINEQNLDGSWPYSYMEQATEPPFILSSEWALLTLQKMVAPTLLKPDLVIHCAVNWNSTPDAGDYQVQVDIKNRGNMASTVSDVALYIDTDTSANPIATLSCPALDPGQTYQAAFPSTFTLSGSGDNILVLVDYADAVDELNPSNNRSEQNWPPVIGGTIYDDDWVTPLAGALVSCENTDNSAVQSQCRTDDQGKYLFMGLPSGDYRVWAEAPGYSQQYYNHSYNMAEATPVTVTSPYLTTGIDIALDSFNPQGHVVVGSGKGAEDSTLEIPVWVENINDLAGYQFDLVYNLAVAQVTAINNGDFLPGQFTPNLNNAANGQVRVVAVNATGVSGSGTLCTLVFDLVGNDNDWTDLSIQDLEVFNSNGDKFEVTFQNGRLEIGVIYGDINGDQQVNAGDAILLLRHIAGIITLDSAQLQAGDLDGTAGVDVGDVIVLLQKIAGLITQFPVENPVN